MTYKNIAEVLNNSILKNYLGQETTVAEDLSNVAEVGKTIATMSADDLKTFQKELVVGVRNEVLQRVYKVKDYGIIKDSIAYGGALQRIIASGNLTAEDSHILNLVNGTSYLDGKYHGTGIDALIYTEKKAFKVVHSVSEDNFSEMFTDAYEVSQFMGLIAQTEVNTITAMLASIANRLIMMGITASYDEGRVVRLLTEFNNESGTTHTLEQIIADRKLFAYFSDFTKSVIARLLDYIQLQNEKYNDGSAVTFTPAEKAKAILNTDFASKIKYIADTTMLKTENMPITFETIPAWQNTTNKLLPPLADTTKIITTEHADKYKNIVGFLYDTDMMGITTRLDKVTAEYVGTEGFTNLHHHVVANYYIDTRFSGLVLTLD